MDEQFTTDFTDINLKQMPESYREHLKKELSELKLDFPYDIWKTKTGDYTVAIKKDNKQIFFHSKYDPRKEARRILETNFDKDKDLIVIGGFGLGYHAEEALKLFPDSRLIIVEKSLEIIKIAFKLRDLSTLLSNKRVQLIVSEDVNMVLDFLGEFKSLKIGVNVHKPSYELDSDFYRNLNDIIKSYINSKEININTLSKFQKLWSRNLLSNIDRYFYNSGITQFKDKFKDVPCIIVAGGPSLQKNIEELKKIKNKGLIIAVNTILQPLQEYGIEADIVCAVDPQDLLVKYFQGVDTKDSILVCEPSVSRRIVRYFPNRALMTSSVFPLSQWVEEISGIDKGQIDIGGSVTTAAYGLAEIMGCNPIVFSGLDLSYSGTNMHIKGTYFEQAWIYESNRLDTISLKVNNYFRKHDILQIDGYYGDKVDTDRKFLMFLWWFESKFAKSSKTIIDATEGGANKKFMDKVPLSEVIEKYFNTDFGELKEKYLSNLSIAKEISNENKENLIKGIREVIDSFENILKEVKKGILLADRFYNIQYEFVIQKKEKPKEVNSIISELEKIDNKILKHKEANKFLSLTIQRIIHTIENNMNTGLSEAEKEHEELRIAKYSRDIYTELKDGAIFNIHYFTKALERLNMC